MITECRDAGTVCQRQHLNSTFDTQHQRRHVTRLYLTHTRGQSRGGSFIAGERKKFGGAVISSKHITGLLYKPYGRISWRAESTADTPSHGVTLA